MKKHILTILFIMLTAYIMAQGNNYRTIRSEKADFVLEKVIEKLENPW